MKLSNERIIILQPGENAMVMSTKQQLQMEKALVKAIIALGLQSEEAKRLDWVLSMLPKNTVVVKTVVKPAGFYVK